MMDGLFTRVYDMTELPTLPDFCRKFSGNERNFPHSDKHIENLPDYGKLSLLGQCLMQFLNIFLIVAQNIPDCKRQMLAALMWLLNFWSENSCCV